MEKKGGGKVRENKIKEWQKEMIVDNQSEPAIATPIAHPPRSSIGEDLMTILQLILCHDTMLHIFAKSMHKEMGDNQNAHNPQSEYANWNTYEEQIEAALPNVKNYGEDKTRNCTISEIEVKQSAVCKKGKVETTRHIDTAEEEIQELEELLRCKVCLDCDACIVFFPCRHMVTCEYCQGFLSSCPVCRSVIEEAVKINEE